MKIEARVERPGFYLRGKKRSLDQVVHVSEAEWEQFGSGGTAQLSFIRTRPDLDTPEDAEIDATPQARREAMEGGVSLADIEGTGKGGRVVVSDVRELL